MAGSQYDAVIVDDCYRSEAIGQFVADLVRKKNMYPGLVFVRKKRHATSLARIVGDKLGITIPAVTSDVQKDEREGLVAQMKSGASPVAVCTDVWSTGIDIPAVRWVLLAGAGQAPAGLKQRAGRGTRLADGKDGYVVYNWEDVGVGSQRYQEQSRQRLEHLRRGGFHVGARQEATPTLNLDEDPAVAEDVEALKELLARPAVGARPSPSPSPSRDLWLNELPATQEPFDWATLIYFTSVTLVMLLGHHCIG